MFVTSDSPGSVDADSFVAIREGGGVGRNVGCGKGVCGVCGAAWRKDSGGAWDGTLG
jgi:hypothetical protein